MTTNKASPSPARLSVRLALSAGLAVAMTGATADAQVIGNNQIVRSAALETALNSARIASGVPALAAAIVVDGVVYYGVTGSRRIDLGAGVGINQVQPDDTFPIGSVSKPYTGTAFARAVDAGLIQWNTTLGQVFPGSFPNATTGNAYRDATVAQLLSHASGMWYTPPGMPAGDLSNVSFFTDFNRRSYYTMFALNDAPLFAPGQGRNYDGGAIIGTSMFETLTNTALETFMQSQVFAPLGMTHSEVHPTYLASLPSWLQSPRVLSHAVTPNGLAPINSPTSTVRWMVGAIHSSIIDMARFAYMSTYPANAPTHLYSATQRDALRAPVGRGDFSPAWQVVSDDRARGIELIHNGNDASSYMAQMRVWPNRRVAFVTATNSLSRPAITAAENWMISNLALFGVPDGADAIDNAVTANGAASVTADVGGNPDPALVDGAYTTAWTTPGAITNASIVLQPRRSRTGTFPTFHRVFLDEGGATAVPAPAGSTGGYGTLRFPISHIEVRVYVPNSPFFTVVATANGVGPQRVFNVGAQSNIARVEVVISSNGPVRLNALHLLN